jgi:hypothetical protein
VYEHHENALELQASAEIGCHLCVIMWHALRTGVNYLGDLLEEVPHHGPIELSHGRYNEDLSQIDVVERSLDYSDPRLMVPDGNPLDFDFHITPCK